MRIRGLIATQVMKPNLWSPASLHISGFGENVVPMSLQYFAVISPILLSVISPGIEHSEDNKNQDHAILQL